MFHLCFKICSLILRVLSLDPVLGLTFGVKKKKSLFYSPTLTPRQKLPTATGGFGVSSSAAGACRSRRDLARDFESGRPVSRSGNAKIAVRSACERRRKTASAARTTGLFRSSRPHVSTGRSAVAKTRSSGFVDVSNDFFRPPETDYLKRRRAPQRYFRSN